jgi:phosphohistidine phosphatase SixA
VPGATTARLYLIRHAKAGPRDRWQGPDSERPLTPRGERQAGAIGVVLAERENRTMSHLVTSPAVRCRDTLVPLAKALGLPLEQAGWLLEGADPAAALGHLGRMLGTHGVAPRAATSSSSVVAACTHGDILWGVLDYLARRGVDLGPRPDAPKGGVWQLDYAGPDVVSARFLLPGGEER